MRIASPVLPYDVRWTLIVLLLIGEIIGLTALFDFNVSSLNDSPDAVIRFSSHASVLLKVMLSFVIAFLLLVSPRIRGIVVVMRRTEPHWLMWLVAQCLVFSAFVLYTARILPTASHAILLPTASSTHPEATWFMGWFALGGLTLIPWLLALAPWSFWSKLVRREYPSMLIAACAAGLIWLGFALTPAIGGPLANISLQFAHQILLLIHPNVVYDFDGKLLGLPSFVVQVAPGCSGYEGIAMITVFMALYLWLFRKELRFPHVLCLFPLAVIAIWLANIARLVSMILFGAYISPSIARGGFHSQAGWINFTLIALVLIALPRHWFAVKETAQKDALAPALEIALVLPLLVMMGMLMLTSALSDGFEALYPLRIVITAAVLWHYRRSYQTLAWGWSWQSAAIGALVFVVWMTLEPAGVDSGKVLQERLAKLPDGLMTLWLVFRVLGSVIIVPIVEELAFRGYLLRQLVAEDFENVPSTQFTWFSFIVSSVLFGLLHGRWLAGILAGMAFALAVYRRGQIGDAVLAHVVANALIAASVLVLGSWSLWA